jgi:hypothetical protein
MTQYGRRDFLLALGAGAAAASVAKVSEVLPPPQPIIYRVPDAEALRAAIAAMASQQRFTIVNSFNGQIYFPNSDRPRRIHWCSNGHWYTSSKAGRRASKKRVTA